MLLQLRVKWRLRRGENIVTIMNDLERRGYSKAELDRLANSLLPGAEADDDFATGTTFMQHFRDFWLLIFSLFAVSVALYLFIANAEQIEAEWEELNKEYTTPHFSLATRTPFTIRATEHAYTLSPKHSFTATVLISRLEPYADDWAEILPFDAVARWGELATENSLEAIRFPLGNRAISRYCLGECGYRESLIQEQSALLHLIPADGRVREQLGSIAPPAEVHLAGHTVTLVRDDGAAWQDGGVHPAHVLYVEKVEIN